MDEKEPKVTDQMISRREFLKQYGAAAVLAPWTKSLLAEDHEKLPSRSIPGTDETLAVMGFGNSQAFRSGTELWTPMTFTKIGSPLQPITYTRWAS